MKISFVTAAGLRAIELNSGMTLMEVAINNGIDGIDGECGGACSCATCHVYVDPAWHSKVGTPDRTEAELLEMIDDRNIYSRLACQIKLTENLDGLVVSLDPVTA